MSFCRWATVLGAALVLSSCEKVIDYPLRTSDEKLVVDGLVTDQPGPYTVRLSGTTGYLSAGPAPTRDADLVTITDVEAGLTDTLRRAAAGHYQTTPKLVGQLNHTYRLLVVRNGQRVEATTRLRPCAALDSISFHYRQPGDDLVADSGYYTTLYFQEPAGRGDYYRLLMFHNHEWKNRTTPFIFDDELYDGSYGDPEIGEYPAQLGDTVRLEMRSLDRPAFAFYSGLANLQYQSGTPFDSPPANAPTNLSGGALGYFGASQVRSVTRVVK